MDRFSRCRGVGAGCLALFASAATLSAASGVASEQPIAPSSKVYLALGGGYDAMPDRNLDINGRTVSSQWKSGWGALAAIGSRWPHGFRTELELSQRVSKVVDFNHTSPWSGTQWDFSLFVNALYDFHFSAQALQRIVPYLGGGVGGAHILWGNNYRSPRGPTIYDAESTKPGWQGIVGVSYALTPKIDVAADYRVKGSGAYTFPGSTTGTVIDHFEYLTHSIFLSIRYGINP
jgi:opacity protein-like surface antigen